MSLLHPPSSNTNLLLYNKGREKLGPGVMGSGSVQHQVLLRVVCGRVTLAHTSCVPFPLISLYNKGTLKLGSWCHGVKVFCSVSSRFTRLVLMVSHSWSHIHMAGSKFNVVLLFQSISHLLCMHAYHALDS